MAIFSLFKQLFDTVNYVLLILRFFFLVLKSVLVLSVSLHILLVSDFFLVVYLNFIVSYNFLISRELLSNGVLTFWNRTASNGSWPGKCIMTWEESHKKINAVSSVVDCGFLRDHSQQLRLCMSLFYRRLVRIVVVVLGTVLRKRHLRLRQLELKLSTLYLCWVFMRRDKLHAWSSGM